MKLVRGSKGEALQDSFVLNMTSLKSYGHYLEIGSGPPVKNNNTYLLEKKYKWKGISIELNKQFADEFKTIRVNPIVNANALEIDYASILDKYNFPKQIDFLQIDIDPPIHNLTVLQMLPFDKYRFSVIIFEHDIYRDLKFNQVKEESEILLKQFGYTRFVNNVKVVPKKSSFKGAWQPFEDWWVDGTLYESINYPEMFSDIPYLDLFDLDFLRRVRIKLSIKKIQLDWFIIQIKKFLYKFKIIRVCKSLLKY
jgi:hypothetical protein